MTTISWRRRWVQYLKLITVVSLAVLLVACQTIGPKALRKGRTNYNDAIKSTEAEQFLLNIVRLRYNDGPYVLEVSSISSRLEVGGEARLTATEAGNATEANPTGASASVTYLEKPTIVYQPLTGQNFVRQLLTPVDLNTLPTRILTHCSQHFMTGAVGDRVRSPVNGFPVIPI